jgi:hypothetical protein
MVFGSPPFRAATFCEPFRTGSGFGWYLYPPVNCFIKWDGTSFKWLPEGSDGWLPMTNVPALTLLRLRGVQPSDDPILGLPVFAAVPESGVLQVWTGLAAVTPPDWSLVVRGVPNFPGSLTYEVLDGIIETGWWHGPLAGLLRFRRSDEPVQLSRQVPLFALQPVPAEAYQNETLRRMEFVPADVESLPATRRMVADALDVREDGKPGGYRREVLSRRRSKISAHPVDG